MRIAYVLELYLAFGVALAAWSYPAWTKQISPREPGRLELAAGYFLPGFGLVGGLGTWLEAARRKSPRCWGAGRWTWAICGLCIPLMNIGLAVPIVENHVHGNQWWRRYGAIGALEQTWRHHQYDLGWVIAAVLITRAVVRCGSPPTVDAREIVGRVFAGLTVGVSVLRAIADALAPFT